MNFLDEEIHRIDYGILPGLKGKAEKAFSDNSGTQTVLDGEEFDLNTAHDLYEKLKAKLAEM